VGCPVGDVGCPVGCNVGCPVGCRDGCTLGVGVGGELQKHMRLKSEKLPAPQLGVPVV
jgi:hypothetical protein